MIGKYRRVRNSTVNGTQLTNTERRDANELRIVGYRGRFGLKNLALSVQSGVDVALSRRRSRVQIPYRAPFLKGEKYEEEKGKAD